MCVCRALFGALIPRVALTTITLGELGRWYAHAFVLVRKPAEGTFDSVVDTSTSEYLQS